MYIRTYVCMYVRMYVCVYVCNTTGMSSMYVRMCSNFLPNYTEAWPLVTPLRQTDVYIHCKWNISHSVGGRWLLWVGGCLRQQHYRDRELPCIYAWSVAMIEWIQCNAVLQDTGAMSYCIIHMRRGAKTTSNSLAQINSGALHIVKVGRLHWMAAIILSQRDSLNRLQKELTTGSATSATGVNKPWMSEAQQPKGSETHCATCLASGKSSSSTSHRWDELVNLYMYKQAEETSSQNTIQN